MPSTQTGGTIRSTLLKAATTLCHSSTTPDLDTELLLTHVIKQSREYLHTYPEQKLTQLQSKRFLSLVTRRAHHEPIAYLIGHKEFFGLDFFVSKHVLIPRPETELLVEEALCYLRKKLGPTVVDVGTGSGAIAISIKKYLTKAQVLGVDISPTALEVARANAKKLKVKVKFNLGPLLSPVRQKKFDCIISNPPYLTLSDLRHPTLRHEPRLALYGGSSGLQVYEQLIKQAPKHLNPGGIMLLEIGCTQFKVLRQLALSFFPSAHISKLKDYAGLDRILRLKIT